MGFSTTSARFVSVRGGTNRTAESLRFPCGPRGLGAACGSPDVAARLPVAKARLAFRGDARASLGLAPGNVRTGRNHHAGVGRFASGTGRPGNGALVDVPSGLRPGPSTAKHRFGGVTATVVSGKHLGTCGAWAWVRVAGEGRAACGDDRVKAAVAGSETVCRRSSVRTTTIGWSMIETAVARCGARAARVDVAGRGLVSRHVPPAAGATLRIDARSPRRSLWAGQAPARVGRRWDVWSSGPRTTPDGFACRTLAGVGCLADVRCPFGHVMPYGIRNRKSTEE